MPGNDDPEELSEEDLAALAEYENSEEGRAGEPEPESPAEQLTKLFNKTPEMQECRETADSITNSLNPEDTVTVQIDVPREFLRLTEFLEQKRATAAGVVPLPTPKVLNQILLNELHDQLHWLVVEPAHFSHYRNLWNRFCDEQGAPGEKIPAPSGAEPQQSAQKGREGPF
jgi:hypothetical protein